MSEKIATLIKVREESLCKEIHESLLADRVLAVLSDNPHNARSFITVTDDSGYNILENEMAIFVGETNRDDFFAQVQTNSTEICRAVKRGYFHWETVNMNKAACQSVQEHRDTLEDIVSELSYAINNKAQLKKIKEAIPDFLPVGVSVIDESGKIIYANQEFLKFFKGSDVKPMGRTFSSVLPDSVVQLIEKSDGESCMTSINGIEVSVRNAPLKSASTIQGSVLVFTEV